MQEIRQLITRGRIKPALDQLEQRLAGTDLQTEITLLQARYHALERERRLGTLSNADANLERNRVVAAILELLDQAEEELDLPAGPAPAGSPPPEPEKERPSAGIYFSYAWEKEAQPPGDKETVVDQLYEALAADGFRVLRDNQTINYGGLISQFIEDLGQGDLICVFISDKYLRSSYCMHELYEIARNSKWNKSHFAGRILPVPLESIRFDDPDVLDLYFDHWEQEKDKWARFIQRRQDQVSREQSNRYHRVQEIHQHIGQLTDWLADINAGSLKLISENDFAVVKEAIVARTGG